ncbi:hypothetical protein JCM17478_25310 [Thermopirellula anaerolimosa]
MAFGEPWVPRAAAKYPPGRDISHKSGNSPADDGKPLTESKPGISAKSNAAFPGISLIRIFLGTRGNAGTRPAPCGEQRSPRGREG